MCNKHVLVKIQIPGFAFNVIYSLKLQILFSCLSTLGELLLLPFHLLRLVVSQIAEEFNEI